MSLMNGSSGSIYASVIEWLTIFDQYAVRCLGIEEADPLGKNYTRSVRRDAVGIYFGEIWALT